MHISLRNGYRNPVYVSNACLTVISTKTRKKPKYYFHSYNISEYPLLF